MIALLLTVCPIPHVAYATERTLTTAEYRLLERYGTCVCGRGTDIDYDVYRDPRERHYRFHPTCGRRR